METATDYVTKRTVRAAKALEMTWTRPVHEEERESAACDAISDILTLIIGIPGYYLETENGWKYYDKGREQAAQEILDRALRSYMADAEDYDETCKNL